MKIIVDEEGRQAINGLVDAALRVGGIQNLNAANLILASMQGGEPKPPAIPSSEPKSKTPPKTGSRKK